MITNGCKKCENWTIKDIIYSIGVVKNNELKTLWFVYGDCFAAEKNIYEKIKNLISSGLENTPNIELVDTKELGKLKRIDPLGITDLRIRGMWHIKNPFKVFDYIYQMKNEKKFQLISLMLKDKFNAFPKNDQNEIINHPQIKIKDVKIKNPNNPVDLLDAKLITYAK